MDNRRKRRLIELGKDLVIALLACSAVYLAADTFLVGGLSQLWQEQAGTGMQTAGVREQSSVAWPVRMAVSSWNGEGLRRRGEQYDRTACEMLFQPAASLLREALGSPGDARRVTQEDWRRALSQSSNLYFDFLGEVPLSVLSGWLSGKDNGLEETVRRLVLAAEGEQVNLYYRDERTGDYYARAAEVVSAEQLDSATQAVMDNGAFFAFELEQYSGLEGDTMLLQEPPQPWIYAVENPLSGDTQTEDLSQAGRLGELLQALSFPENSYIYTSPEQVVSSGNDRLRVSTSGVVRYTVMEGEQSRYTVPAQGDQPTAFEAAEACRQLADGTAGAMAGEARLYLQEIRQTQDGWQVDFGYCLDGARVQVGEAGYAAHFQVQGGEITQFVLQLRSYTQTGERSIVLPEQQAMAAMEAMGQQGGELALAYQDMGDSTVSAGWVTE